jgi:Na+/phosphate symporter
MVIYASLLVAAIGFLIYILSPNAKFEELGRLAFGCGLLAFLLEIGSSHLGLLAR